MLLHSHHLMDAGGAGACLLLRYVLTFVQIPAADRSDCVQQWRDIRRRQAAASIAGGRPRGSRQGQLPG